LRTASRSADPVAADAAAGPPTLETRGLSKQYGSKRVLHDLSLTVGRGEVFGFLGPNGAGKTTTVKILLGLVRPSSGQALLLGRPSGDPSARRRVGYLPENFRFHDWMTGYGLLDFHGRLAGMSAAERRERIPQVIERVGLAGRGDDRIRAYSKGMTQRIGLAQALLNRPELVILDEPTSALDPIGRREVRDLIRELKSEGVTVFLNSHLLSEIEMVCDRVSIVDRGRVVRTGRLSDLADGAVQLQVSVDRVDGALLDGLRRHGRIAATEDGSVLLEVDDLGRAADVADEVVRGGRRLFGLTPRQRSLEDVFVELVERSEP
jgi:ABC-2 type transport system ATP-binding protein